MAASGTARHAGCDLAAMAGALAALLAALDEQWKERLVGGMDDLTNLARLRVSPDLRDEDAADTLALPRAVLAAMLAHVAAGYPDEACGILAGAAGRVTAHFPAENASTTPRVFSEIAPEAVLAIWGELEAHGWE